jgi:hypothetical protein
MDLIAEELALVGVSIWEFQFAFAELRSILILTFILLLV